MLTIWELVNLVKNTKMVKLLSPLVY